MEKNRLFKHRKTLIYILLFCVVGLVLFIFFFHPEKAKVAEINNAEVPFLEKPSAWADSMISGMSIEEKAAQLLMLSLNTNENTSSLINEVKTFNPGGFFISGGAVSRISLTTNLLQDNAAVPLFFAAEAPCGFYCTDDSLTSCAAMPGIEFLNDTLLINGLSTLIIRQMKHCGIHINLMLPLQSINLNHDSPRERSYYSFANSLQKKLLKQNKTFKEAGLFACACGFETDKVKKQVSDIGRFDTLRRMTLASLINKGLQGAVTSSAETEMCDSLKRTYKYDGLIFSKFPANVKDETAAFDLLNAGCDMIIIPEAQKKLAAKIIEGIADGKIPGDSLNKKVKRVLLAKSWAKLNRYKPVNADSANYYCTYWKNKVLYHRIIESSAVLLNNRKKTIPLRDFEKEKFVVLQIGKKTGTDFYNTLLNYTPAVTLQKYDTPEAALKAVIPGIKPATIILLNVFEMPDFYDQADNFRQLIDKLSQNKQLILSVFGSPQFLSLFNRAPCMLWCNSTHPAAQQNVCSIIFGGEKVNGKMPYSCSQEFCYLDGMDMPQAIRFKYTDAEDAGIDGEKLYKIDSIVNFAINNGAFPGCQVFFARKGKVFYNKSFGTHTYDKKEKVRNSDLYDIASVTKVAATTLALMSLYDKGKIKLDTTLNYYFNDLDKNSRGRKVRSSKLNLVTLRELLIHRSGLPEGLPIGLFISPGYALKMLKKQMEKSSDAACTPDTLNGNGNQSFYADLDTSLMNTGEDSLLRYIFSNTKKPEYYIEIAQNLYLRTVIIDSLWQLAKQSYMNKCKNYLYSDLNFYLVMKVVEKVAGTQLDKYLDQSYIALMNLKHIGFHPLQKHKKEEIAPTEDERYFRKQLIHGYVHDPMAAMLGGIGGNAGLFSNTHDLGVLMQMLLNKGTYGGMRFLSEKTVELFTAAQQGTYRGLGFDRKGKPDAKMIAPGASLKTYGHTGFTGTCVWVDPEYELVYVFLSNRVHPKNTNQKINTYHVRQNIQQVVYGAMVE
ncbi:MAG TPA: serine hydrolase [Bacteroidales bacterium]|nr:serine hydrolase [Bacteroidales bacterium]